MSSGNLLDHIKRIQARLRALESRNQSLVPMRNVTWAPVIHGDIVEISPSHDTAVRFRTSPVPPIDAQCGPADPDGSIQYNNGGVFGGEAAFTYDDATNQVDLSGNLNSIWAGLTLRNASLGSGGQTEIHLFGGNETEGLRLVLEGPNRALDPGGGYGPNYAGLWQSLNAPIVFGTNDATHMVLSSFGSLLLGLHEVDGLAGEGLLQIGPVAGGTTKADGLLFYPDANLYRSDTSELTTDDRLIVMGDLGVGAAVPNYVGAGRAVTVESAGQNLQAVVELVSPDLTGAGYIGQLRFINKDGGVGAVSAAAISSARDGADDATRLTFWTEATGVALAAKMTILGNGRVGIGTTAPDGILDVRGLAIFSGGVDAFAPYLLSDTLSAGYYTDTDDGNLRINHHGYLGGDTRYRDLQVMDGKSSVVMRVDGSERTIAAGTLAHFIMCTYNGVPGTTPPEGALAVDIDNDDLYFYSSGAWHAGGGGVTDHGALTGLNDDDHGAVYGNIGAVETITGAWTFNGAVVINELGADVDFRIESLNDPYMFFMDASADRIGIGSASPNDTLHLLDTVANCPAIRLDNEAGDATGPLIRFYKSRLVGDPCQDLDDLGTITWTERDTGPGWREVIKVVGKVVDAPYGRAILQFFAASNGSYSANAELQIMKEIVDVYGELDAYSGLFVQGGASVAGGAVFNEAAADVDFRVASTGRTHMLFVDASTHRVGIGESSPTAPLHISGTEAADTPLVMKLQAASSSLRDVRLNSNTYGLRIIASDVAPAAAPNGAALQLWGIAAASNQGQVYLDSGSHDSAVIALRTGGTGVNIAERMHIDASGNVVFNDVSADVDFRVESNDVEHMLFVDGGANCVGVGKSVPTSRLHVAENVLIGSMTAPTVVFENLATNVGDQVRVSWIKGADTGTGLTKGMVLWTYGTQAGWADYESRRLSFYTGAAAAATEKVAISAAGGLSVGNAYVGTDAGAGNAIFTGKIGVGATAPTQRLEVAPDTDVSGILGRSRMGYMGYADYAGFAHVDKASVGNFALLQSAAGATILNVATGQSMYFRINNADKLTMDSSGNLTLGSAGVGDLWIGNNCSALSFTDRTPFFVGDALKAIRGIRGGAAGIHHESLPEALRVRVVDSEGQVEYGRDMSATLSMLIVAVQQLLARVDTLEEKA
uniref:Peptidase S74 domain-containing protein n=1 Tax=viral metagenome TaxID=1070528 RepID=A0A6M3J281_9ZZZZ